MKTDKIRVRGARQHNLRGVDLDLPKNSLIVFTGVSGSGKSSLAFDTIFVEGQRRYVESLSAYARQFLDRLQRPQVRLLDGLPPAIAIDQGSRSSNPRSTVATITEIYDYLRVLYAAIGLPYCPDCGEPIGSQTRESIVARILQLDAGTQVMILAPVIRGRRGEFRDLLDDMSRRGYVRARVDGKLVRIAEADALDRYRRHDLDIVVDRVTISAEARARIAEAVEDALKLGEGSVLVVPEKGDEFLLSAAFSCDKCGRSIQEPTHAGFSFNSPRGMCKQCNGIGTERRLVPELLIENPDLSLDGGAIPLLPSLQNRKRRHWYQGVADHYGFSLDTPLRDLTERQMHHLFYGSDGELIEFHYRHPRHRWEWRHADPWSGIVSELMRRYRGFSPGGHHRHRLEQAMRISTCPACGGLRLNPEALAFTIGGRNIAEVVAMTIEQAYQFFEVLQLSDTQLQIAEDALQEIRVRLRFLNEVGLGYLNLDRRAPTLSGGEAQRVRLATQVGSGLVDCVYVLDEPSIGLHHRDQGKLLDTLKRLRDQDNTIIVVEHDAQTMLAADRIVDFGPGAGVEGGRVVAEGTPRQIAANSKSLTGQYLSGRREIPDRTEKRREGNGKWLTIRGARHNNLTSVDAAFPLGRFICVTGVSGSGKSSLVTDTLYPALANTLHNALLDVGHHDGVEGLEHVDKVIFIDQDPIGRTPRSTPATYTKALDHIRALYAQMPESRQRGYKPGRFSFNVRQGRCEACEGHGYLKLESDFMADVWVECDQCYGARFSRETLDIRYRGKSIAQVLDMSVAEAVEHFQNQPKIRRILDTLHEVGLGYLKLGQPATTLSGGEAQRIKLARELARPRSGRTVYVLDEPTTGMHFEDVRQLLEVLHGFADESNTVIVVEHHPDVVKTADYIMDMGPEGGAEGGRIVAQGSPEQVASCPDSHTGAMLREMYNGKADAETPRVRRRPAYQTDHISVTGARQHNLKNLQARIPRHKLTALTGVSGSGKTSLAVDTIYAEGQRRYVESLSSYARQFVQQMEKPKVDRVSGLSPAISLDHVNRGHTPRSTVGTVTEIYDYLRVLMARLGQPHCPACDATVGAQTVDQMADRALTDLSGERVLVCAPLHPGPGESYELLLQRAERDGWRRIRLDGQLHTLPYSDAIDRRSRHEVEVVVDRLAVSPRNRSRLAEALEAALQISGQDVVLVTEAGDSVSFSRLFACHQCGRSYRQITPRSFSFNHPDGWCELCEGLGTQRSIDLDVLVPDDSKSLREGAVKLWGPLREGTLLADLVTALAEYGGFSLDRPWKQLSDRQRQLIIYGTSEQMPVRDGLELSYTGLVPGIEQGRGLSRDFRHDFGQLLRDLHCPACGGRRVRPEAAAVRFCGHTIGDICSWPLHQVANFMAHLELSPVERPRAEELLRELRRRLRFLVDVGLEYLTLDRSAPTLSGGEAQRVKLAAQLGADLTGVLYVLDEPTVGVHPRDNERMLRALRSLREEGNTVLIVEHDPQTLQEADYLLDFGPEAGRHGGQIVAAGTRAALMRSRKSLTGQVLSGKLAIPVPRPRRPLPPRDDENGWLTIVGAREHNLKNIDVPIPLGVLTVITGPSGSGKSTLMGDILFPELIFRFSPNSTTATPGRHRDIIGTEAVDAVYNVDQSPIGQSPRSNPATYVGVFDEIRRLYSQLPLARTRGYTPTRFSFNRVGGRCEACEGLGSLRVAMHFLPDVWVHCEQCEGRRYSPETLEVEYRGHSIASVLEMTVDEAAELFGAIPGIIRRLSVLQQVGLGYLPLGQPAPTLSGGESQRVKLAAELAKPARGHTLYLLDEPTTGLHTADIRKLLAVINSLVDRGNTVLVVEHNLDLIKTADYVIDLGPGGGENGGRIVARGRPEQIARRSSSATAPYLKQALEESPQLPREELYSADAEEVTQQPAAPPPPETEQVAPPWERDGRTWHMQQITTAEGKRPQWPTATLETLLKRLSDLPGAGEPDYAHPDRISIAADDGETWAYVKTDAEWALQLVIYTQKSVFDEQDLAEALALPPWDDLRDVRLYGRRPRVRVYTNARAYDRLRIMLHHQSDVTGAAFAEMLQRAWDSRIAEEAVVS